MNKRGFTLIELLAVIVVLGLLALLTSTAVTKLVKDAKSDLSNTQMTLIKSSAETWMADNLTMLPKVGECGYLTLKDLKLYGILEDNVLDLETNKKLSDNLKIKITTTLSEYGNPVRKIEANPDSVEGCFRFYEPICTFVPDSTITGLNIGAQYSCKVDPDKPAYNFFVVNTEENMVDLIMDSNVNRDGTAVTPGTKGDTSIFIDTATYLEVGGIVPDNVLNDGGPCQYGNLCMGLEFGPVNAMRYLSEATSSWTNINEVILNSFAKADGTTEKIVSRAKLISSELLTDLGCTNESCPSWLTINTQTGYWFDYRSKSYYYYVGRVSSSGIVGDQVTSSFGVRPVITVPESKIEQ